jgi:hypothetical protein
VTTDKSLKSLGSAGMTWVVWRWVYMRTARRLLVVALLIPVLITSLCYAQYTGGSDPLAISLAKRFVTQSSGAVTVGSYLASANVTRWNGGESTIATGSMQGMGYFQSRIDMQFSSGVTSEIRGVTSTGLPSGAWTDGSGTHQVSYWNTAVGTHWYFPLLSSIARYSDSTLTFNYVGQETWNGANTLHIRVTTIVVQPTQHAPGATSVTDYYLDPQSFLLLGMASTLHSDAGSPSSVPWEVHYSRYENLNGGGRRDHRHWQAR